MKIFSQLFFILNTITLTVHANVFDDFKGLNSQTPGCAIGVVKKDKLVYENYFGQANLRYQIPIDRRTVFNLGSITKHFTAALALQLEKKGQISLNDSLKKYYPQGPNWFADIKLHHLINHQSGLPDYLNDDKTRTVIVKKLSKIPHLLEEIVVGKPITRDVALNNVIKAMMELPAPSFKPSEIASYSNTGYLFLADIIETSSGISFSDLAQKQLFKPIAMTSTEFVSLMAIEIPWSATGYDTLNASTYKYRRKSSNLITHGSGGLLSTLPDFVKWISHLIKPKNDELFWSTFLNPVRSGSKLFGEDYNNGMFIKHIEDGVIYSHSGLSTDSMGSYFWISPVHKVGYIQLCNFKFDKRPTVKEILEIYGT